MMKALVWEAPKVMVEREQTKPAPESAEVLIKVDFAGICGSELSGYLGHNALRVPPLVMGHEFAGTIVEMGESAQAANSALTSGQVVTVNPLIYCGECEFCQQGVNQLCVRRTLVGAHRPGAYAEFVSVPAHMVTPLPEGLSPRLGALTEPVACAVRIGELAGSVEPIEDKDCLIIGAGPIGLLALQILQTKGAARIFIADLDPERLAMGEALGGQPINPRQTDLVEAIKAETDQRGVAVAVDAVGTAATRSQCVAALRTTGTLILTGLHEESSQMPVAEMIRREIVAKGSFAYSPANFAAALKMLQQGTIRLDPWIVEVPLAEGGAWFDRLIEAPGDVSKVLLVP